MRYGIMAVLFQMILLTSLTLKLIKPEGDIDPRLWKSWQEQLSFIFQYDLSKLGWYQEAK